MTLIIPSNNTGREQNLELRSYGDRKGWLGYFHDRLSLEHTHTHTYTNAYACTTIGCAYVERGRRERKLALSS